MANRIKMLFSDAPPDALENLLSPRRKLLYGLFAFGPGTVLGLYLYSVKKQMERENEVLRLKKMERELNVVQKRHDKDFALANAIQEMRDRLRRLEDEAIASRHNAASNKANEKKMQPLKEVSLQSESKIEVALALLKSNEHSDENEQKTVISPSWLRSSFEGSEGRRHQRHEEMLEQDIAAHIASKQNEQSK